MTDQYVSLHNHTHYSLLDGMQTPQQLVAKAVELEQSAIAITDHGAMGGIYQMQVAADEAGIKSILGCEMYMAPERQRTKFHLLVLAQTDAGLRNLMRLSSTAHTEGFYYKPTINWSLLDRYGDGLLISSACASGEIPRLIIDGQHDEATQVALKFYDRFADNFYLELMPLVPRDTADGRAFYRQQVAVNMGLMSIAHKTGIKAICTTDAHYPGMDDWFAHDVLLCIQTKSTLAKPKMQSDLVQLCPKNRAQMLVSFQQYYADIPLSFVNQMLDETIRIAEDIDGRLALGHNITPLCKQVPDGMPPFAFMYNLVKGNWQKLQVSKTAKHLGLDIQTTRQLYIDRLRYELGRIKELDFVNYLLIVWDLYQWVQSQGILAGPGRGSSASSLVCYLLDITQVDPIYHGLDFDRFIAPQRVTSPDIDMDYPDCDRGRIEQYLRETYGDDHVAHIGTYGSMKGRMVLKDIGRVLGISYDETNRVTKLVFTRSSGDARASLTALDTLSEFKEAQEYAKRHPQVIPLCKKLEGLFRHGGIHAAGLIVTPKPVVEYVPLERRKDNIVTATDHRDDDKIGLLKLDVLGLSTLTQLQYALALIDDEDLDLYNVPLDSPEVYEQFDAGNLAGIFQFDSRGMMRVCQEAPVENFIDVINLNALYRPSGMRSGLCARYLRRRKGTEEIRKLHPIYDEITKNTMGIVIFQEQVMALFRQLAGFPAVEVDKMRKKIAKSTGVESLEMHRRYFIDGCLERKMGEKMADTLYTSILHFGSYGFNLGHATAYSHISYWCMWLRVHYPQQFWAAWLSGEKDLDRVREYIAAMTRNGMKLLPPDINESADQFLPTPKGIRASLADIKFCGDKALEEIVAHRPYISFQDFLDKIVRRKCNARVIKSLIKVGAFDCFGARDVLWTQFTKEPAEWDALQKARMAASVYPLPLQEHLITHYEPLCAGFGPHVNFASIGDIDFSGKSQIMMLKGTVVEIKYNRVGQFEVGDVTEDRMKQVERMMQAPWNARYVDLDVGDATGSQRVRVVTKLYDANADIINNGVGVPLIVKVESNPYMKLLWAVGLCGLDELQAKLEAHQPLNEFEQALYVHPLDKYGEFREAMHIMTIADAVASGQENISILGTVRSIRTNIDKNNHEMSFCMIEDGSGSIPFIVWAAGHKQFYHKQTVLRMGKDIILQLARLNDDDWALDIHRGCKAYKLSTMYKRWQKQTAVTA